MVQPTPGMTKNGATTGATTVTHRNEKDLCRNWMTPAELKRAYRNQKRQPE
jgi:hypothetical protein